MLPLKIKNLVAYLKILAVSKQKIARNIFHWENSLKDPDEYYLDAFRFFYFFLPRQIRLHKSYFSKESRGFGEKAFHSMWYLLYNRYNFRNYLEIGVYRGQILSLMSLIGKLDNNKIEVHGISPFENVGDTVSSYIEIDYLNDVFMNFESFRLDRPSLTKAYSTDHKAAAVISSRLWDCIYIDGSHNYDIAKKDWLICSENVRVGGVVVLDDSSLYTDYTPPFFAFKGHPGPSQVANEIGNTSFKEVLRVGHNRVFERIK